MQFFLLFDCFISYICYNWAINIWRPTMIAKIKKIFSRIPDTRVKGRTKYELSDILFIVFISTIVGCCGWTEIADLAAAQKEFFYRELPNLPSIPRVDTIARAIAKVDPKILADSFIKITMDILKNVRKYPRGRPKKNTFTIWDILNFDGKNLKGAVLRGCEKTDVIIVNAVISFLTLACRRVEKKSNEITVFPELLEILHKHGILKGKVVTIDAMGCQKSIAAKTTELGAKWQFALKKNHGHLFADIKNIFSNLLEKQPEDFVKTEYVSPYDLIGGRVERRKITVVYLDRCSARSYIRNVADWAGIKTLLMVERTVEARMVKGKSKEATKDIRYFISSLELEAEQMLEVSIKHWSVETIHQQLDVSLGEDKCRIRRGNAAENLSTMRKEALNILNHISRLYNISIRRLTALAKIDLDFLIAVLTKRPEEIGNPIDWLRRKNEKSHGHFETLSNQAA
jgi:predicted transposase YbfD/YdcC